MKKWWLSAAVSLAVFAGLRPGVASAQPDSSGAGHRGRSSWRLRDQMRRLPRPRLGEAQGPVRIRPRPPAGGREPRNGDPPATGRVRVVGTRRAGRDAPEPTRRTERSRRRKRKSSGHGSPLAPRTLPPLPWIPSFRPIRTDGPSTTGDRLGRSDTPLAGQVSPAAAPLPDRSCPRGGGRRGLVGLATKSDPVGIGSILLVAGGSGRDPDGGAGVAIRGGRERSGFASTLDGPPLARDDRRRVAGHHGRLRRTRCPPRVRSRACGSC